MAWAGQRQRLRKCEGETEEEEKGEKEMIETLLPILAEWTTFILYIQTSFC